MMYGNNVGDSGLENFAYRGNTIVRMTPAQHRIVLIESSIMPKMDSTPICMLRILLFSFKFIWLSNPVVMIIFGMAVGVSRLSVKVYTDPPFKSKLRMVRRLKQLGRFKRSFPLFIILLQGTILFYKHISSESEIHVEVNKKMCFRQLSYKIAENKIAQDCKFFAVSKLKFVNTSSFYRVLSLLAGDIEINPGPNQLCKVCNNKVNKRSLFCYCGVAYHIKCFTNKSNNLPFVCMNVVSIAENRLPQTNPDTEQLI